MHLSKSLHRLHARLGGFRGNVDGIMGDVLQGWVQSLRTPDQYMRVGLYVQGARIHEASANIYRGDLERAGIGDGCHGFSIPLTADLVRLATLNGGQVEIRVLSGASTQLLGKHHLSDTRTSGDADGKPMPGWLSPLQRRLYGGAQVLAALLSRSGDLAPPPRAPGTSAAQQRLFSRTDYLDPEAQLPELMFGYAEYIRYRDRLDEQFDTAGHPDDIAHFYKRYLSAYAAMRGGLRVPLTRPVIDWLNEPVVIGGQRNSLSRAAWFFLPDVLPIRNSMNFNAEDWYIWAVYWWSVNQAEAIHCEDCLVPDSYIDLLRSVPTDWQGMTYAPSEFMLRQYAETPEIADLNLTQEDARRDLTCALLLLAVPRPDFLRYIPRPALEAALNPNGHGPSPLAQFCTQMGLPASNLDRSGYARALRQQGFDLDTMRFLTFTSEGHRAECATLPPLPHAETVDVQVIGPFAKASGLGQATRLSASALESAGVAINTVDFGLDNPAPEGFSRAAVVSDYTRAKVNLFHLNAEAIPLAAAYQPDVFTGAYNIGYFYWELDSPGACHYLGMDMLDEIWVSTEFGVSIFQPHVDMPVTNVGMSYEALPDIPADEARAFLQKTAKIGRDVFTFMVTFDSFSFVQRKNPLGVLKAFAKAFPQGGDDDVRLVIKTQNRTRVADPTQIAIWEQVDEALAADSRIVLIDETLQYTDLLKLKKGADAYISLHKSEGWGFGMIEAMNLGVPVLATAYSGNMDFCTPETCWLVDYELKELGPQDYIFVRPGQKWAEPDADHAARQMRAMKDDPADCARRAAAARQKVQTEFSEAAIGQRYATRIHQILAEIDQCRCAS